MPSDYEAIGRDNITDLEEIIGRAIQVVKQLYSERTHFIFELLQNAEDALERRKEWQGSRAVAFELQNTSLRVSHYGDPFNEDDVRAICNIGKSEKTNQIGRFGIGFKSVYEFTDRPQIHSGSENFCIEKYFKPIAVSEIDRHPDETVIEIPFKKLPDNSACDEIAARLEGLGVSSLLFLREIEEIVWSVGGGASGDYLREEEEVDVDSGVRRVTIIGEQEGKPATDEEWLVFSSPVTTEDGKQAKPVEIAFSCVQGEESKSPRIRRVDQSPLVVFFPTIVETSLGFRIQGPYRTTPSRDNIDMDDDWNKKLVEQTASLLRESLCWLRDNNLLDTEALRCLPLNPSKFEAKMFAPLFEGTKYALQSEALMPRRERGYVAAKLARLGGTQVLRDLFNSTQLATLYGEEREPAWLSDDITRDRTRELYDYMRKELEVPEITPNSIIQRLDETFLEAQSDDWIQKLYEFLNELRGLQQNLWFDGLPLLRLESGKHVSVKTNDEFQAFLPTETVTGFPTIRKSVCTTESAREFLQSLGMREPDLVDDVIEHVLPRYQKEQIDICDADYEASIERILSTFDTDSTRQRNRLIGALKETPFVRAIDASDSSKRYAKPGDIYLATERLKNLLQGVRGVLFVDDSFVCLRGGDIRELLERCGAFSYFRPISDDTLSDEERCELRKQTVEPGTSGRNDKVTDWTLAGLNELLEILSTLDGNRQKEVAGLLWIELAHLEERRGKGLFTGKYTWSYYGNHKVEFPAAFVRQLQETAWVPDADEKLHRPEFVLFDSLGWNEHPFLESKIHFKPRDLEMLAQKTGMNLEMLEFIKEKDVDAAELRAFVEQRDKASESESTGSGENGGSTGHEQSSGTRVASGPEGNTPGQEGTTGKQGHGGSKDQNNSSTNSTGKHEFISYVAVRPEDDEPDPDNLNHENRMTLEAKSIERILTHETDWQRTEQNNPGYDLYKVDSTGRQSHWCEVKAMKGSLQNRPVGISHTQFDYAIKHGKSYWLYVVEYAGDDEKYRIVKIQDPVGKARTFTFDHGWIEVGEVI